MGRKVELLFRELTVCDLFQEETASRETKPEDEQQKTDRNQINIELDGHRQSNTSL